MLTNLHFKLVSIDDLNVKEIFMTWQAFWHLVGVYELNVEFRVFCQIC